LRRLVPELLPVQDAPLVRRPPHVRESRRDDALVFFALDSWRAIRTLAWGMLEQDV
jgi:hypothetical protein